MNQKEYIGAGTVESLGDILNDLQITKTFLVCGKKSFSGCGAEAHVNKIKNAQFIRFNDFETNPKIEDVNKGLQLFRQSNADAIIAIGGGSAIDIAKLIRCFSVRDLIEVTIDDITNYSMDVKKKQPPFIVIPTTAGSGSEATSFAVLYADKVKYSVADNSILPDIVIIDPLLSMSLSPYNTAVTGMDALCHAVESYWSINSTDESKEYARRAISIILNNLPETVHNPFVETRLRMAEAANLAGKAINISKTTAAHAISYTLTSYFGIPHGLAVGLLLPDLLVYNSEVTEEDAVDSRGVNYIKQIIDEINQLFGEKDSQNTKIVLEKFIQKIKLSANLSFHGIKQNDIDLILQNINIERLGNNPRKIVKNEIRKMLELKVNGNI
jgi:alcohol dehydrogenase class IV